MADTSKNVSEGVPEGASSNVCTSNTSESAPEGEGFLENAGFSTQVIHAGELQGDQFRALATPIYQTATFGFQSAEQGIDRFQGKEKCYAYTRGGNPTIAVLEEKVAALEGGVGAVACASGMGATASLVWTFLQSGDHIVIGNCLYGCSDLLIRQTLPKFNVEVTAVDTSNIEAVKAAIRPNTKMIFFETPTNPLMKVTDIAAVKELAGDIMVVVDNTFAPPPVQKPFECGADIIIHSATKYLNGHGDVISGLAVSKRQDQLKSLKSLGMSKLTGSVCSPFDAYLNIRGLQTLELRMQRHCENALAVAKYLETRKEVKRVYYPRLESFEGYDIVQKQMHGLGTGILSFELQKEVNGISGYEAAKKIMNNLQIPHIAVSLGDPFSLVEHPYTMTHAVVPDEVKLKAGITPELVRFSAGLENTNDLISDFEQTFAQI